MEWGRWWDGGAASILTLSTGGGTGLRDTATTRPDRGRPTLLKHRTVAYRHLQASTDLPLHTVRVGETLITLWNEWLAPNISQKSLLRCQCANTESVLHPVLARPSILFFGRTAQLTESYTVYTVY